MSGSSIVIHFKNTPKMDNDKSELFLTIIMVKLAILCTFKLFKIVAAIYKKHNAIILEKNFNGIKERDERTRNQMKEVNPKEVQIEIEAAK